MLCCCKNTWKSESLCFCYLKINKPSMSDLEAEPPETVASNVGTRRPHDTATKSQTCFFVVVCFGICFVFCFVVSSTFTQFDPFAFRKAGRATWWNCFIPFPVSRRAALEACSALARWATQCGSRAEDLGNLIPRKVELFLAQAPPCIRKGYSVGSNLQPTH